MPRKCTVCIHKKLNVINRELLKGTAYRIIAKEFRVSEAAVQRHFKKHIPAELLKAYRGKELIRAENLNREVQILRAKTYKIIAASESRLLDPENSDLYSIIPTKDDVVSIIVDSDGSKKIELNRERSARLLLESIKRAERLVELQVNLDFIGRLEKIEDFIKGR